MTKPNGLGELLSHRGLAAAALVASLPAPAEAQTVQSITATSPNLGNVVSAATGTTTFRVAASGGAITKLSGNGVRLSTGSSPVLVTISCASGACNNKALSIRIGSIGSPSGRVGALGNFTVSAGTASISGASGTDPLSFTIAGIKNPGTATFWVGMDAPILADDSAAATGNGSSSFYVYVAVPPAMPTTGSTSAAIARVFRPISIANPTGLVFGKVVRPASGSGSVAINATTGARTLAGAGALGLSAPTPGRATYTVTGEGGQAFTLSVPASFQMTGPGAPLTVTLTSTASGSQTLSSAAGAAGSLSFGVGGAFPLSSSTTTGTYSGTYAVTVTYN